jgi:Zn-dependent protease
MTPRFRVAGIPVSVHLLFLLTAFATGSTRLERPAALLTWMAVVFVSVLLHELGHALAYRRLGCRPSIELHGFGGTTTGRGAERLSHKQDAWVSFAGPGTGFLLGGLVLAAQRLTPLGQVDGLARTVVGDLLWVNIGWGLINLLPILPLDGGHIVSALVRSRSRDETAGERRVHIISLVAAAVLLVVSVVWLKSMWLGVMALILGVINFTQLRQLRPGRRYLVPLAEQARRNLPMRRIERDPEARKQAAIPVSRLLAELKRPSHAKLPAPKDEEPDLPHDPGLVGEMLLDNGLASLALRPLQKAFTARPSPETAHPLCVALLDLGRHAELATLLEGPDASQVGVSTLELIVTRAAGAGQAPLAARAQELMARRGVSTTPGNDERH